MLLGTLLLVLIGALFILLFSPERIPITSRRETEVIFRSWNDTIANLVPKNVFQILTGGADFLLPVYLLSFVLGFQFPFDRTVTQQRSTCLIPRRRSSTTSTVSSSKFSDSE